MTVHLVAAPKSNIWQVSDKIARKRSNWLSLLPLFLNFQIYTSALFYKIIQVTSNNDLSIAYSFFIIFSNDSNLQGISAAGN